MKNRIPRKLKKKLKKSGVWFKLSQINNYFKSPEFFAIRDKAFDDLMFYGSCTVDMDEMDSSFRTYLTH